jgi:hypothetical protein
VGGAFAQSFEIHDDQGNDVSGTTVSFAGPNSPSDLFFKYEIDFEVVNTTGAVVTSKVKRIETTPLPNTSHYHCYGVCYSDILAGADYIFPESGDAAFLDFVDVPASGQAAINTYFKPKTGVGTGVFRFVVFNDADPTDSAYVDLEYNIHAFTGVEELKKNFEMSMYPNPSDQAATISFSGNASEAGILLVEVTDMLGKKQKEMQVAAAEKQVRINTEALKAGIYFVSIRKDGQIIRTSKLIVKH